MWNTLFISEIRSRTQAAKRLINIRNSYDEFSAILSTSLLLRSYFLHLLSPQLSELLLLFCFFVFLSIPMPAIVFCFCLFLIHHRLLKQIQARKQQHLCGNRFNLCSHTHFYDRKCHQHHRQQQPFRDIKFSAMIFYACRQELRHRFFETK